MAGLPRFEERIRSEIVAPMLESNAALRLGVVMNAYYERADNALDESKSTPVMYGDVSLVGGDGGIEREYLRVPLPRVFGIQSTLPPLGTNVVLGFLHGARERPVVLAYFDSDYTKLVIDDLTTPKPLPRLMTQ